MLFVERDKRFLLFSSKGINLFGSEINIRFINSTHLLLNHTEIIY